VRVLIVPNTANPAAVDAAGRIVEWLGAEGVDGVLLAEDAVAAGLQANSVSAADLGRPDLVVALGGDGTILKAVHRMGEVDSPVLGVKFGRLGFMSGARPETMFEAMRKAMDGDVRIERRSTLAVEVVMEGRVVGVYRALNEVVLSRGASGRVIGIDLAVSGQHLTRMHADGVIVATATGSTAYALSAGGPIIAPGFRGTVIVPVAAHSLKARPIVVDEGDVVEIGLHDPRRSDACVIVDGDVTPCRRSIERVTVRTGEHDVALVKLEGRDFFETVSAEFFGA